MLKKLDISGTLMTQWEKKMSDYIHALINALNNSMIRAKYYEQTGDIRFLNESSDWADVAKIYMKEIAKNDSSN